MCEGRCRGRRCCRVMHGVGRLCKCLRPSSRPLGSLNKCGSCKHQQSFPDTPERNGHSPHRPPNSGSTDIAHRPSSPTGPAYTPSATPDSHSAESSSAAATSNPSTRTNPSAPPHLAPRCPSKPPRSCPHNSEDPHSNSVAEALGAHVVGSRVAGDSGSIRGRARDTLTLSSWAGRSTVHEGMRLDL